MKHIKLRTTHRLIYKIMLGLGTMVFVVGLGMTFFPQQFFSQNYTVLDGVLPIPVWGTLWAVSAALVLAGITKFSYLFVRAGLAGLTSMFGVLSIGIFTNQIFNSPTHGLIGGFVYAALAYITFSLIKEPPINPETAVKIKQNETQ